MPKDQRRAQIVDATVALVIEEGLSAATVRRIAGALHCSPGQIHHHFAAADDLRMEAVREINRRIRATVETGIADLPPREQLIVLLSGSASETAPDMIRSLTIAAERLWREALDGRANEDVRSAILEGLTNWRDMLVEVLKAGMASGHFPADLDPEPVMQRLLTASFGLDVLRHIMRRTVDHQESRTFLEGMLVREGL